VADFFVVRSPLHSLQRLVAWAAPDNSLSPDSDSEHWLARQGLLRERLKAVFQEVPLLRAVSFASADLERALAISGQREGLDANLSRTLTRYLMRSASRETPFGLFAGVSLGHIAQDTNLRLGAEDTYRSHASLATTYLTQLVHELGSRAELTLDLPHELNSTLVLVRGSYRFATCESSSSGSERAVLLELGTTPLLERALSLAGAGITPNELARALAEGKLTIEHALDFVRTLCKRGVLVPAWLPAATEQHQLCRALTELHRQPSLRSTTDKLGSVHEQLARANAQPLVFATEAQRGIASQLLTLAAPAGGRSPLSAVLVKPAPELAMSERLANRFLDAAAAIQRTAGIEPEPELEEFCRRFSIRYEARFIPLVEALDHDLGVGFGSREAHPQDALLGGIPTKGSRSKAYPFDLFDRARQSLLQRALASGSSVCVLDDEALALFPPTSSRELPESFAVMARLARLAGDQIHVVGPMLLGPSVAATLGRFWEAEPQLSAALTRLTQLEQALAEGVVLADIAYSPMDESANVASRPVLREYEIPYWGKSSVARERQIPVSDLYVAVEHGRVLLYSKRLQKRIKIRLGNAVNFTRSSHLTVFRFLGALQAQDHGFPVSWSWGALSESAFLPRVVLGTTVLSVKSWRLSSRELEGAAVARGAAGFTFLQQLRAKHQMPRWLTRSEGEERLLVDLDNELSVDELLQEARKGAGLVLKELLPDPDELVLSGPEGGFAGEFVVPFVRKQPLLNASAPSLKAAFFSTTERQHPPGSNWLYAKIYASRTQLDRVMRQIRAQVVEPRFGLSIAQWHFLPFADPESHVRVRFNGEAGELSSGVLPDLRRALQPLMTCGVVSRLQLDTYEQEVERYGGAQGVALAEAVFSADSDAACQLLELCGSAHELRWQLALLGIDRLFADCGFEIEQRAALARDAKEMYGREIGANATTWKAIGVKYRQHAPRLTELLWQPSAQLEEPVRRALEILEQRSSRIRPIWDEIQLSARGGSVHGSSVDLAYAFAHLHAVRLLGITARSHELVLYDFLRRQYAAHLARNGGRHVSPSPS
jgi:thiopeptide-type bacteriocin biosynthesis protein